jgi:serine/threonine-protein kinase RsbT
MPQQKNITTIRSDVDIVTARSYVRDLAKKLGFSSIDQARLATAVSELARNIYLYAGTGTVTVHEVERQGRMGIEIEFRDDGPGMNDIDQSMQDGYTTSRGMGLGLPGAKRLVDDFEIKSQVGIGTMIVCRKWKR